jgi:hypothetical protein
VDVWSATLPLTFDLLSIVRGKSNGRLRGHPDANCFPSAKHPYRNSARVVEASDVDCTILRPAWLNDRDEVDYETTEKGEAFKNPFGIVSRKGVADLVVKLATTPGLEIRRSLGVHKTS